MNLGSEFEDFFLVLIWILGYFWSFFRGVSFRFECGYVFAFFFRAVVVVLRSSFCGLKYLWFFFVFFLRGFFTRFFYRVVLRVYVVGVDFRFER